jgi:hypothetical protein
VVKFFVFVVRQQLRKVVLRALLGNAVGWSNEDIGEETWLRGRNVCEPAAHGGRVREV